MTILLEYIDPNTAWYKIKIQVDKHSFNKRLANLMPYYAMALSTQGCNKKIDGLIFATQSPNCQIKLCANFIFIIYFMNKIILTISVAMFIIIIYKTTISLVVFIKFISKGRAVGSGMARVIVLLKLG